MAVFSGRVEPRRTALPVFPQPPLKFRTAGFPQYGFKRTFKPATFATTYRLKCRPHTPAGVAYTLAQCSNPTHLVRF